jgi:hypothetical protein
MFIKHFPKKTRMVSGFFRKMFGDLGYVIACYILAVACSSKTIRYFPKYFKSGVLLKKFPGFCKEYKEQTKEGPFTDFAPCCLSCSRTPKLCEARRSCDVANQRHHLVQYIKKL